MRLLYSVVLLACLVILTAGPAAFAQSADELASDRGAMVRAGDPENAYRLALQLSLERKAGNIQRARELERQLFTELPSLPEGVAHAVPVGDFDLPQESTAPLWGGDVKVYTGNMYSYGKRQLCIDADTVGGIYLAMNAVYRDTASAIYAYRSTNSGVNWTYLGGFTTSTTPIQSFDMCVTDTAGGKWVLAFAFIVKTDRTSGGGGNLLWGKFLNDGSGWSVRAISNATSATGFRNPSICTDGTNYAPGVTYHYVASEYITPSNDASRGLYITRTTNWGVNWVTPDTTIRGFTEATPVIGIDWSTSPDSLVVAFTRLIGSNREIRVARNSLNFPAAWTLTYPSSPANDVDPAMAIDPVRGNAMITYTRVSGSPKYNDAMYLRSTDLFKTYTRDSIATSTDSEELTSVSYAPWGTGYYWRVVYRSSANLGTIYYKALMNTMGSFYTASALVVNQYRPTGTVAPVVGFDRDVGGTFYRGNATYVGFGPTSVYFDAVDLSLSDAGEDGTVPGTYRLDQNYPNPFNPTTAVRYYVPVAGPVRLAVYDLLGREVALLVDDRMDQGTHIVNFDASDLASGIYMYRLTSGDFAQSRKMVLLK